MTTMTVPTSQLFPPRPEKALTLALRLAHAENALLALTAGQVDAIVDPSGHTYLLRPAQEHLRQNEARMQALIESASDVITVVDRGGAIISQSRAVRRVLGYEPEELVGSGLFERVHEDDLPRLYSAFFNVIEEFRTDAVVDFRHLARDGSYRRLEATVSKLRDTSTTSVVLICRDVTKGRQEYEATTAREALLVSASQAKDRFLAMISHELRTPLAPAVLGVQTLQEDERFTEAKPTLAMIRRNLDLQSRLLEELSDFTTLGHHKLRLRPERIDAHDCVRFALETCQSDLSASEIEVLLNLRASESMVLADPMRLQQVIWNLLKNAIKFSTPGSSISIATVNDLSGRLTIELTDHGIGIEPELLPLLFDPFQQGTQPIQQLYGGLGLGMFIAKGLAEAQHGTLTVSSEGRGRGATFRLTLNPAPLDSVALEIMPPAEPQVRENPRLALLFVEDHEATSIIMAKLLRRRGHSVVTACSCAEAEVAAAAQKFDYIISDLNLPDGSGHELMSAMRDRFALTGIAVSGFGDEGDVQQALASGFVRHFIKPIDIDVLQNALVELTAESHAIDGRTT